MKSVKLNPETVAVTERHDRLVTKLLHLKYNGVKPDATEKFSVYQKERCTFELWNAAGPEGGIVVTIWSCPGQSKQIEIHYFDDARTALRKLEGDTYLPHRLAIDKLAQARMKAIQEKYPR